MGRARQSWAWLRGLARPAQTGWPRTAWRTCSGPPQDCPGQGNKKHQQEQEHKREQEQLHAVTLPINREKTGSPFQHSDGTRHKSSSCAEGMRTGRTMRGAKGMDWCLGMGGGGCPSFASERTQCTLTQTPSFDTTYVEEVGDRRTLRPHDSNRRVPAAEAGTGAGAAAAAGAAGALTGAGAAAWTGAGAATGAGATCVQ
jgi:hypothetical protein